MVRYTVLIGGELGAYGITFPGFDAVAGGAMGATVDEALRNAEDVLADVVEMMEEKGEPIPSTVSLEQVVVEPGEMVATSPSRPTLQPSIGSLFFGDGCLG